MNRARKLWRWLRAPLTYPRGGLLLWIILLGSSHEVGQFLLRHPWAGTALPWILAAFLLVMFGCSYWRRRRHN